MATRRTPATPAGVHYRVEVLDVHRHLFQVTLTVTRPQATQVLELPVWIPGSYLVREFARHVHSIHAQQGKRTCAVTQLDKCSWSVQAREDKPLTVTLQVHAHDASVRTAWLDVQRGFFNGTSVFLRVKGHTHLSHTLEVVAPAQLPDWHLATGLSAVKVDRHGFGTYQAAHYDELADCPVEMGAFWSGEFRVCGSDYRFVVAGAPPSFDGERLLADTRRIVETQVRFWHGKGRAPHSRYVFMLWAVSEGYGGLEHRNSTALICKREDLPQQGVKSRSDGYVTLLGLISHEYFHTWNVKRLRPAQFAEYDYQRENMTSLLWFFEGFTSYYDDVLLCRSGLIDASRYLKLLNKTVNQVLQTPGRQVQTVAQASFEAWTKYYRPDDNSPNITVSYYTKGALVALCLDLSLRAHGHSLDDVMRALWKRCAGGPMSEDDLLDVLHELTGTSWQHALNAWVHSTDELPLRTLLQAHGVQVHDDASQWAQRLGLRATETQGIQIKTVLHGGVAQRAGLCAGDEWLGIEVPGARGKPTQSWRLMRLDDVPLYAGTATRVTALVSRDRQLLRIPLNLTDTDEVKTWRLSIHDAPAVQHWLHT
jgi:predicted metalloprotease with PDZ domain